MITLAARFAAAAAPRVPLRVPREASCPAALAALAAAATAAATVASAASAESEEDPSAGYVRRDDPRRPLPPAAGGSGSARKHISDEEFEQRKWCKGSSSELSSSLRLTCSLAYLRA